MTQKPQVLHRSLPRREHQELHQGLVKTTPNKGRVPLRPGSPRPFLGESYRFGFRSQSGCKSSNWIKKCCIKLCRFVQIGSISCIQLCIQLIRISNSIIVKTLVPVQKTALAKTEYAKLQWIPEIGSPRKDRKKELYSLVGCVWWALER